MKSSAAIALAVATGAAAFHPTALSGCAAQQRTVTMAAEGPSSRRTLLGNVGSAAAALATVAVAPALAFAEDAAVEAKKPLGPAPADWGLTKEYYTDAAKLVGHMRYCTAMEKGAPNIADIAGNCRKEMTDFVSYYRRFPNTSGKLSYSNLYTSINVLAGHYSSYGPKFPVPEKRRKRLNQEYNDIEKAIKRQR